MSGVANVRVVNVAQSIYSTDTWFPIQRFPNQAPEGRTDTLQLSYIPQLLAEYIHFIYFLGVWCQIVRGVKLYAMSNCSQVVSNCPGKFIRFGSQRLPWVTVVAWAVYCITKKVALVKTGGTL